ncbi:MAG: hypothetical protein AAF671_01390 [Pseudomonadota bacterium]
MDKRKLTFRPAPRVLTERKSKAALREELIAQTDQFLQSGGEVRRVETGASAWDPGERPPPSSTPIFGEPKQSRTPVPDVVARIEARREALKQRRKPVRKTRAQRSRQKMIYDDFGEPLRKVWVDD